MNDPLVNKLTGFYTIITLALKRIRKNNKVRPGKAYY